MSFKVKQKHDNLHRAFYQLSGTPLPSRTPIAWVYAQHVFNGFP